MNPATTPASDQAQPVGTGVVPPARQCRRSRGTAAYGSSTATGQSRSQPGRPAAVQAAQATSSSTSPRALPIATSSTRVCGR
ncbi:hypothetical protein, partial [Micromonospora sp. 4G55]|uniref:hypothetical protein n=1 Tax=Micromonospora sp. 4G55 TaxID=2806102 RepID=UPI001A4BFC39